MNLGSRHQGALVDSNEFTTAPVKHNFGRIALLNMPPVGIPVRRFFKEGTVDTRIPAQIYRPFSAVWIIISVVKKAPLEIGQVVQRSSKSKMLT